jgi:hypothetical protein
MKHFQYYPQIEYSGITMTNLMVRAKIRDAIKNETFVYYTFRVTDTDRPDILASKYYGNSNYTWAIFYANDIMDPLSQWPLTQNQFNRYIIKKYGSISYAQTTPHHYLLDNEFIIDKQTYEDVNLAASRKRVVSCYEHEEIENDKKRDIKIIDSRYISQLVNELSVIFKS